MLWHTDVHDSSPSVIKRIFFKWWESTKEQVRSRFSPHHCPFLKGQNLGRPHLNPSPQCPGRAIHPPPRCFQLQEKTSAGQRDVSPPTAAQAERARLTTGRCYISISVLAYKVWSTFLQELNIGRVQVAVPLKKLFTWQRRDAAEQRFREMLQQHRKSLI